MAWTDPEVLGPVTTTAGIVLGALMGRRPARATAAEAIERAASSMVDALHKELQLVRVEQELSASKMRSVEEQLAVERNARIVLERHVSDLNEELRSVRKWAAELHEYAHAVSTRLTELGETPGEIPVAPLTT